MYCMYDILIYVNLNPGAPCKYIYIYKSLDRNLRGILKKFFLRNFILEKGLFLKKKTERLTLIEFFFFFFFKKKGVATKIGFAVCNCTLGGG